MKQIMLNIKDENIYSDFLNIIKEMKSVDIISLNGKNNYKEEIVFTELPETTMKPFTSNNYQKVNREDLYDR